jgi:hypothetical protein
MSGFAGLETLLVRHLRFIVQGRNRLEKTPSRLHSIIAFGDGVRRPPKHLAAKAVRPRSWSQQSRGFSTPPDRQSCSSISQLILLHGTKFVSLPL